MKPLLWLSCMAAVLPIGLQQQLPQAGLNVHQIQQLTSHLETLGTQDLLDRLASLEQVCRFNYHSTLEF